MFPDKYKHHTRKKKNLLVRIVSAVAVRFGQGSYNNQESAELQLDLSALQ